ncbi:SRPBCC family protein [Chitinophaga japonensis]|uniref:Uncharacterized protein YndB with AHSA1/START domain n=1 Tax=Chitinophaga japonensis TaxID=104662 RepID=A0A562TGR9_CHIJA|nr:SRPBCC domain-containing protein [Chitinophaga japonensis]TWI92080.1 uncharacterized protein YndB with AHSA1/START domain [Chitinophaga japonensis]
MSTPLIVANSIVIHATAAKVWDALVNPVQTKKYMFGCEPVTNWQPGSTLLWKGNFKGVEMTAVKGHIKAIEPEKFLSYTVIDPNDPKIPDIPENYLTVTYTLTAENGHTSLHVTQGDYANVANGQERYQHTIADGGWASILEQVKKLVEEGQ